MRKISRKILPLAVLAASCFSMFSVSGFAQTQEELNAPTLRQIPAEAKEIDISAVPTFSGQYYGVTVVGSSQSFSFGRESKKIDWWTTGCGQFSYVPVKVFETASYWYLKTVSVTKSYGKCTPTSYVLMVEVPKSGKDGFYSSSTREGTLKMN